MSDTCRSPTRCPTPTDDRRPNSTSARTLDVRTLGDGAGIDQYGPLEPDGKLGEFVPVGIAAAHRLARAHQREIAEQRLPQDTRLEPRQRQAQTQMRAGAEDQKRRTFAAQAE